MQIFPLVFATLASSATLEKRCSPAYNPDYYGGYYRRPCWVGSLPNCRQTWPSSLQLELDAEALTATISPLFGECVSLIAVELDREAQGLKPWGWSTSEGTLDISVEGVLVISNMTDVAFSRYHRFLTQGIE